MNYQETTQYLFSAMPSFQNVGGDAYKPGLERVRAFCEVLGDPHLKYPVIHIAGTNGKGSTSHMIAAAMQGAGLRVGLFTSPHLFDFRERMRVNGAMISEAEVVDFVAKHRPSMESLKLSFFEMTAAMAFDFFARSGVDIAVIETGLGGRLDATNIVSSQLSVITNIGIDHTQYLGDTIAKIAGEKAGIIKRGSPAILGERGGNGDENDCSPIFEAKAKEICSSLIYAENSFEVVASKQGSTHQEITLRHMSVDRLYTYTIDLMGEYQSKNLATALTAISQIKEILKLKISENDLQHGLRNITSLTGLRGRWQRISTSPLVVCDTGHNIHGLKEVTRQLSHQSYNKLYCVLGFANDKDLGAILPLFPQDAHFIFTRPRVERAFETSALLAKGRSMGLSCEAIEGVQEALQHACTIASSEDMIFVGGSTFMVAELDL